ncbi:MAG: DNA-processing protein DprA [Chakrabartia sp.]
MTAGGPDRLDKLRLIRSAHIGAVSYGQLLQRFGSAANALEAIPALAARGGGRVPHLASVADAEVEMARVTDLGARHVFLGEADYPPLLAEMEAPPPVLIVRGDLALARRPNVALVGARNASAAACRFARLIAADLAGRGVVVTSGLARGIDAQAHQGALTGGTIAVIASGIDISYPPEHADLQAAIAEQGLLVTEQPPGRDPLARHFPARNRIIAGLAKGVVVVEAAPKSGSLITARLANEAGRDVMAVPGSPLDPRSQGCNQLIRDGAVLVQTADDILETIADFGLPCPPKTPQLREEPSDWAGEEEARRLLMSLLSPVAVSVDELVRQSAVSPGRVQLVLLELELAGRLERHAGGRVSLL